MTPATNVCLGIATVVLALCVVTGGALKCYQCAGQISNDNCNKKEHLKECNENPDDTYDVCETSITTNADGKRFINKKCMKTPCRLTDDSQKALDMQPCHNNKCTSCCSTDACNKDSASTQQPVVFATIACSIFALWYVRR